MPVWNAAASLPAAVACVQMQTFRDWSLIVVDDGSTDDSLALLERMADEDSRIRVLAEPHRGLAQALNIGLQEADASWVARMDADDRCVPERLEKQLAYARVHPECDVIASQVRHVPGELPSGGLERYVRWMNDLLTHDAMARQRFIEQPLAHPSVLVRREAFERYGVYRDGDFPEDYELWLRWFARGACFGKVPEPLLAWCDYPGRFTRTNPRCTEAAIYALKARYIKDWLDGQQSRPLWVWGAGRQTRKRVAYLQGEGVSVAAWVDIDPAKIGQRIDSVPVHPPEAIPQAGQVRILGYVASWGAREAIRESLSARGHLEGVDFWLVA